MINSLKFRLGIFSIDLNLQCVQVLSVLCVLYLISLQSKKIESNLLLLTDGKNKTEARKINIIS